jgi:beclin 1
MNLLPTSPQQHSISWQVRPHGSIDTGNNTKKPSMPGRQPQYPPDRRELYDKTARGEPTPLVKRVIPTTKNGSPSRTISTPPHPKSNESFVVLTQSQISNPPVSSSQTNGKVSDDSVSQRLKVSAKLFDAISGRSDIDYPMCTECAEILLEIMSAKHVEVKKERDGYLEFMKQVQNEGQITAEEKVAAEKELEEVPPPKHD